MRSFADHRARIALAVLAACALVAGAAFAVVHKERRANGTRYVDIERLAAGRAADRPNVIFIYTDDQNYSELRRRYMPQTMRLLVDGGTAFSNYVVATPVCCPSRATTLTGSYPHNDGVLSNRDGWGGLVDKQNNLGTWMQQAGYRTAWIGKFLQGYKRVTGDAGVPAPGFDDWLVTVKPKYFKYKLYTNTKRGLISGSNSRGDYLTDRLTAESVRLIKRQAQRKRPLFMVVNQLAPHRGKGGRGRCHGLAAPAPRDLGRFAREPLPRPASFNRIDSGHSAFGGRRAPDAGEVRALEAKHRCRAETLAAADRSVAAIYRAVARTGELDNTVFVFTSDNGILLGEHGRTGKSIPYEEGIRMPLVIKVPSQLLDGPGADSTDALAANVDLAPTLLELAGADPCISAERCRRLDGRSLMPLLNGRGGNWPSERAIPIEGGDHGDPCAYRGLRLRSEVLIERVVKGPGGDCLAVGGPEHYDLAGDPDQLHNRATNPDRLERERISALQRRLLEQTSCRGGSELVPVLPTDNPCD